MFFSKKGIYQSGKPAPSLLESLEVAHYTVIFIYSTRVVGFDPTFTVGQKKAMEFIKKVKAWLAKPENNASRTLRDGITIPARWAPEADASLFSAAAYLLEAADLARKEKIHDSWTALLQCYFHLGRANGGATAKETAKVGGKKNAMRYDEIVNAAIGWLNERPENSFPSLAATVVWITPKIKAFESTETQKGKKPISFKSSTNASIDKLIQRWRREGKEINAAFDRVVDGPIKAGAKKKIVAGSAVKKKVQRKKAS